VIDQLLVWLLTRVSSRLLCARRCNDEFPANRALANRAFRGISSAALDSDWPAGHVRLELKNVGKNYPFERSHRFREPSHSGYGDYSRLSCDVEDTQLGPCAGSQQARFRGCSIEVHREVAGSAAILRRSRDDRAAAKRATPLRTLRWTFPAKRACVVSRPASPDGFASLPRQRSVGLRGV
jgi:hypothetical protein